MKQLMAAPDLSKQTLLLLMLTFVMFRSRLAADMKQENLLLGFEAVPDQSVPKFQPLLRDSKAKEFSLGFLRVNSSELVLAVVHVDSMKSFWQANPRTSLPWSKNTRVFFNGSLVLRESISGFLWSTQSAGGKVVIMEDSNLKVLGQNSSHVAWQSFDFPTNVLVEDQILVSNKSLISRNGLYSMRLGSDFMALLANFGNNKTQIYWKHEALQARAKVIPGQGPLHLVLNSEGFLGLYQQGNPVMPVDIQPFNSYRRTIDGFRFIRLESDGNLKGYYWSGTRWILDYTAIDDTCQLPSPCGSYGLCLSGDRCSCLMNNTTQSHDGTCLPPQSGDFCGEKKGSGFSVWRATGVTLPFKELMSFTSTTSMEECENVCSSNCTCWGVTYSNASGLCYVVDYPIQTVVRVHDVDKIGYFKVKKEKENGIRFHIGLFLAAIAVVVLAIIGITICSIWRKNKMKKGVKTNSLLLVNYRNT